MALIDLFLRRAVTRGELTVIHHDGRRERFGTPDPAFRPVTLRFADSGVARAILRNASLGAGEMFTDGRLVVEDGDVLDLVLLMTGNDRWETGRTGSARPSPRGRPMRSSTGSTAGTWSAGPGATSRTITT